MRSGDPRTTFADINVTPFVDVMLVLLVIFMVTAPLMRPGIQVALPKASTGQPLSSGTSGLTITLTKEHVVYFNNEVVTLAELRQKLAGLQGTHPVFIRADRYAYVNHLIALWDLCRDLGVRDIHVATVTE